MAERPTVVGVDVGGTNMQFGVVGADDAIAGRARARTGAEKGLNGVVENLVAGVRAACADAGLELDDVAAVGIAAAGAIDMPRGVVLDAPNLGWHNVPLRDVLEEKLGRPVVLDNDVNGAVWGEYRLGAGGGRGDVLGVWVGTGVGGGLVIREAVYRGDRFTAGEIGHTVIRPGGAPKERTVEDLCSRTGMLRWARGRVGDYPDSALAGLDEHELARHGTRTLVEGFERGDALLTKAIEQGAELLGIAVANWVTVLSLGTVIVGGGITEALGGPYLDRIRESFMREVFPDELRSCELLMTRLAADSALLGAALLARERV